MASWRVVAALAFTILAVACDAPKDRAGDDPGASVVWTRSGGERGGGDAATALVLGEVSDDAANGCYLLMQEGAGEPVPLVWPSVLSQ